MRPIVSCLTTNYGPFGGRAAVEHVRAAGLEQIELAIRTAGVNSRFGDAPLVSTSSKAADLAELDRFLADHGVQVASCNCISGNPLDPAVLATVLRKLDLAAHFGVTLVVAEAGAVKDEAERLQLYRHLVEIGDHAGRLGMTVCFETHAGVCVNHAESLRLMHELQHPQLRLNPDTANLRFYNESIDVVAALAEMRPFVRHMHLKDSRGVYQQRYFPALGAGGAVDFRRVHQVMRDGGFNGPFSIEIGGIEGEGVLSLPEYQARVAASVQHLKEAGYFS